MIELGFNIVRKMGKYVDCHERDDVVENRKTLGGFL